MTEQELGNLQYHCERTLRNHETPNDGLVPYYAREILALIAEVRRLRGSPNYVVSFSCGTCVRMDCLDCNLKKLNDYKEASNG